MMNKEIVLEVVKNMRGFIYRIDNELKDDPDVIAAAGPNKYAGFSFVSDRERVLEAVKENGTILDMNPQFHDDREILLETLKNVNGSYVFAAYIGPIFYEDRELMMEVVKKTGDALLHPDFPFKLDREIVFAAVKQDGIVLSDIDPTLKRDKNFMLSILKSNRTVFGYIDDTFKIDPEFARLFIDFVLKDDPDFF